MQQRLSLSLFLLFLVSSCAHTKYQTELAVCVSDPEALGFQCYDKRKDLSYFLPYGDSNEYIALSPTDMQELLKVCSEGDDDGTIFTAH